MIRLLYKKLSWEIVAVCLSLAVGSLFTACDDDDDDGTGQFAGGSAVSLNSFGPCPAARGGILRFIGSNMDRVTGVVIPQCEEITEIEKVSKMEIRVTIPQEADTGKIVLNTPEGAVTTLTSITYSEPIGVSACTPTQVKAGDVLTIDGEYLNLINEVKFADGVIVEKEDFVSRSRKQIRVIVPEEARTGKIIVSDGAEIPIEVYSEEVIEVVLPAVASVRPNPLKAGGALTITGKDFDLVAAVVLPGGEEIAVQDVTTEITIEATPADIREGWVVLVAKSGVEVKADSLMLVKPAINGISSATVKNGGSFTITGTDLDLVSEIVFGGTDATVASADFTARTATEITVVLPATATDGAFTLKTLSGTETAGEELTFVKPEVTALSATNIKAKETLQLTGTDLDLIAGVKFGAQEGEITAVTATALEVKVPVGAESGALTLITVNGTEFTTQQTVTIEVTLPEITSIASEGPGKKITVVGEDLDLIKAVYFADEEGRYTIPATIYGTKTPTLLEVYHVEGAATGYITPLMVTFEGDEGYMPSVYCAGVDEITGETVMIMDFNVRSESDWHGLDWDNWGNSYDPAVCKGLGYVILLSNPGWWIVGCNHPDPNGGWPSVDPDKYVLKIDVRTTVPIPVNAGYRILAKVGGQDAEIPLPLSEDGTKIDTGGEWVTVKMDIGHFPAPTPTDGDFGLVMDNGAGMDWAGLCLDNLRFDPK